MIWTLRFIIPVLRLGSRQPYEIDGCYVYPHVQMRKLRQQSKKLLRDTKPGMQGWDSNVGSVALLSGTALNHYATSPPQGPGGPGVRETHNKQDIICCPNWPKWERPTQSVWKGSTVSTAGRRTHWQNFFCSKNNSYRNRTLKESLENNSRQIYPIKGGR